MYRGSDGDDQAIVTFRLIYVRIKKQLTGRVLAATFNQRESRVPR